MKFLLFIHFQHNSKMYSCCSLPEPVGDINSVSKLALEQFIESLIGDVIPNKYYTLTVIRRNKSVLFFAEIECYYSNIVVRGQIRLARKHDGMFAAKPRLTCTENFHE